MSFKLLFLMILHKKNPDFSYTIQSLATNPQARDALKVANLSRHQS